MRSAHSSEAVPPLDTRPAASSAAPHRPAPATPARPAACRTRRAEGPARAPAGRRPARRLPSQLLRTALAAVCAAGVATPASPDAYPRQPVDVLHYEVSLSFVPELAYEAQARLDVRLRAPGLSQIHLDFDGPHVDRVMLHGDSLAFRSGSGRLSIDLGAPRAEGEIVPIVVEYHGRPDGHGLRAGRSAHGNQTLFADNWPENARRWFPAVDHPSDKATFDLTVTAEARYDVVAPGRLMGTRSLRDGRRITRWSMSAPIPTYCMVFGMAEFQVTHAGAADGVPISVWAFPDDAPAAARKLARTALILERFSDLIAPYPYEKLAHVQSSTVRGAVEYASAVFYAEGLFQGPDTSDGIVAHELAHQWWGNSVTPADWDDLWLSEGFATYFHGLFEEGLAGYPALRAHMARAADRVRDAAAKDPVAVVVDPAIVDPAAKLGPMPYLKGAWVLHMLRRRLGDDAFFGGLRRFYRHHAGGNAATEDLRRSLEAASGQSLQRFFGQWLHRPGWPDLEVGWSWDATSLKVVLDVEQVQAGEPFEADLDVAFRLGERTEKRAFKLHDARHAFAVPLPGPPDAVEVDPDGWLLHTARVARRPPSGPDSQYDARHGRPGGRQAVEPLLPPPVSGRP